MALTGRVGSDGTVRIPDALRRRYGMDEGAPFVAEARADGVLIRLGGAAEAPDLLAETLAAYASLRADEEASRAFDADLSELDGTLLDGLEDLPWTSEAPPDGR